MATLRSEDQDFVSFISLHAGSTLNAGSALSAGSEETGKKANAPEADQVWQIFQIEIGSGERRLQFSSAEQCDKTAPLNHLTQSAQATLSAPFMQRVSPEQLQDAVENQTRIANAFMLCRQPSDEIRQLVEMLGELIAGKRTRIRFEPAEPCFELSITNIAGGMRVDFFVDAGNVETGIYRWDALGVRFFTDLPALESFATQLKAEFDC